MSTKSLFAEAPGVVAPLEVTEVVFSPEEHCFDITIDFPRGSTFISSVCSTPGAKTYDTREEKCCYPNFFQYTTYLHARVPRVKRLNGCGVKRVRSDETANHKGAQLHQFVRGLRWETPVVWDVNDY